MNTLLIVGVTAMVAPMTIAKSTVKKDLPFAVFAAVVLLLVCMDHAWRSLDISGSVISRADGLWLLAGFALFMFYTLNIARKGAVAVATAEDEAAATPVPVWKSLAFVVVGLACLVFGSNLFVDSASAVASELGVSEGVIGLTIVAGGTSLPELATSVVAARKGRSAIAIGNVIGSNVFNVLCILGLTAVVCPMQIQGITLVDLVVMVVSILLVWFFSYTKYTVARWEGAVLSAAYLAYLAWLLYNV